MSDDEKHELVVGKFDPHSDEVAITQDYSVVAHVYGGDAGKTKALALDFVRGAELSAENARLRERVALLEGAGDALLTAGLAIKRYVVRDKTQNLKGDAWFDNLEAGLDASEAFFQAEKAWTALAGQEAAS